MTMTEIPSSPRYSFATYKAHLIVANYKLNEFPFDLFSLCKELDIKLRKYSKIAKKTNTTVTDVAREFKSNRGWIYRNTKGKYYIAYNDLNDESIIRFTIAHELGHFFMNHLEDFEETELRYLSTENMSKKHRVLENEASCFGRNLVAPVPLSIFFDSSNPTSLSNFFGIGYQAANTRLDLLKTDKYYYSLSKNLLFQENKIFFYASLLRKYLNLHYCQNCYGEFSSIGPEFCVYCGSNSLHHVTLTDSKFYNFFGGNKKMKYTKVDTNESGTPLKCPRCKSDGINDDFTYCPWCSTYIHNVCLGGEENRYDDYYGNQIERTLHSQYNSEDSCSGFLDGGYRYCPHCGSETSFYRQGLLNSWKEEFDLQELPF